MSALVDVTGRPIPTEPEIKIEQYKQALMDQNTLLLMGMQVIRDLIDTDGRECDQAGDLHSLTMESTCPGCRARAFYDSLALAGTKSSKIKVEP